MSLYESYRSPLETRYASAALRAIWSPQRKYSTWRRLWLALAEAQRELGLNITQEQVDQLAAHLDDIDYEAAASYEEEVQHDVMAHILALGDAAPAARPIIHLGTTSQYVNCNTELLQIRDSLQAIAQLDTTVWDWRARVNEVFGRSGRPLVVTHAGRRAVLASDPAGSTVLRDTPLGGDWVIHAPLLPGEVIGDSTHAPPDHLRLLVHFVCER